MKVKELLQELKKEKALDVLSISYSSQNAIYINVMLNNKCYNINIENIKSANDFYLECLKSLKVLKVLSDGVYVIDLFINNEGDFLNIKKPHILLNSKKSLEFINNYYSLDNVLIHAPIKSKIKDNDYYFINTLDDNDYVLSEALMFELLFEFLLDIV